MQDKRQQKRLPPPSPAFSLRHADDFPLKIPELLPPNLYFASPRYLLTNSPAFLS